MNAKDNFIFNGMEKWNNKETTKREQRKEIDGSNHEFENFENIYIYIYIVKRNQNCRDIDISHEIINIKLFIYTRYKYIVFHDFSVTEN